MNILHQLLLILFLTSQLSCRRHRQSSSSEEGSIENLLYYKEAKLKSTAAPPLPTIQPVPLRAVEEPPPCPCPKMCCSMCCECNDRPPSSFMLRQMQPSMQQQPAMQQPPSMPQSPAMMRQRAMMHPPPGMMPPVLQPPVQHKPRVRKKKPQQPLIPPIGTRRDMSSTKDHIRGLISHDEDIKKILKDLVKVTIKKVNLLEEIGSKGYDGNGNEDGEEDVQEFEY